MAKDKASANRGSGVGTLCERQNDTSGQRGGDRKEGGAEAVTERDRDKPTETETE